MQDIINDQVNAKKDRMKRLAASVTIAFMASTVGVSTALASDAPSNAELYKMLLELKDENSALKAEVKRLTQKPVETASSQGGVSQMPSQTSIAYKPSIQGGIDVMFMEFHAEQGAGGNSGAGNGDDYFPDMGRTGAYRVWAEATNNQGVGLRGRYFTYKDDEDYFGINREPLIRSADLEVTFDANIGNTNVKPFVGLRWQKVELSGSDFGGNDPYQFKGYGLTVGTDLKRQISGPFSFYASGRYSFLNGKTTFTPTSTAKLDNTLMSAIELRAGVQWERKLANGADVGVMLGWEQHYYGTDTYLPFAIDPETLGDVGLGGPSLSAIMKF